MNSLNEQRNTQHVFRKSSGNTPGCITLSVSDAKFLPTLCTFVYERFLWIFSSFQIFNQQVINPLR